MHPVKKPLLFKVRYVFVDSCQAFEPHSARNLFKRRGIAIAEHKRLQEVENLFLPSSNSHGRIIANKKRIATILLCAPRHLFAAGIYSALGSQMWKVHRLEQEFTPRGCAARTEAGLAVSRSRSEGSETSIVIQRFISEPEEEGCSADI
jgi:hypothetical protein